MQLRQRTIRTMAALLLVSLLCAMGAGCALAQEHVFDGEPDLSRVAVTQTMCELLKAPQEDADVLICYYPGVRVEVVAQTDDVYVQVNAADGIAGISGYMRREDLIFGEAGMRQVQGMLDAGTRARLLGWTESEIEADASTRMYIENQEGTIRFVNGGKEGALRPSLVYATYVDTFPVEGELSLTDAIAFAKAQILADHESGANLDIGMDGVTAEGLERCHVGYMVLYDYGEEQLLYVISFHDPETMAYYAFIELFVQGEEIVRYDYGNG